MLDNPEWKMTSKQNFKHQVRATLRELSHGKTFSNTIMWYDKAVPYTVFYASLKKVSNRKCPNHHFVLSAHLYTYCFKIELTFYCYITKPAIINIGHKDVKVRTLVSFLSNCRKTALHSQSEGMVHITRKKINKEARWWFSHKS